ncbi:MAG: sulfatase [Acidobacteriota bacterium]
MILPTIDLATIEGDWGGAESWGAWGVGQKSTFDFFLRWRDSYQLYLVCRAADDPQRRQQTVEVLVNGQHATSFDAGKEWQTMRLDLPSQHILPGQNRIELVYGFHLEGQPDIDPRPLALAIEEIGLLKPDQSPRDLRRSHQLEVESSEDTLHLSGSGTYIVPLDLPSDAEALELGVDLSSRGDRLQISIMTHDGSESVLLERDETSSSSRDRLRLPLAMYRDRQVFLIIDTRVSRGGEIRLRAPRLIRASPADTSASSVATTPPTESALIKRPDIVVVVLDAARTDRFGVYGYERDTTPHIDRLASESLVFANASAECPYTACSMPNLLAGLSFLQHGVVARSQRLASATQTLAEVLSQLGYQTLAYSGNPNSGRATGSDQGFDEMYEVWRIARGTDRTHPRFLTDIALERLEEIDERPLFLLLHYVPPHEPYSPDPEFDLFGDPGYDGPVVGDQRFVQAVFKNQIELDDADVAELSALYDGNLRMADHYVNQVIKALQQLGRWDDTLFIVTSDHGEAFNEHGVLGHNQTIYDEMLRVPLILRLPQGQVPEGVDTQRLASLADVVPTVLEILDYPSPVGAVGHDLLAPTPVDQQRLLFLRSAQPIGAVFGLRTPRWKLMARAPTAWERGSLRLYDLEHDPMETVNLATQRRLLLAGLMVQLERALLSRQSATAEAGEIPEADREMLESLGYL